VSSLSNRHIPPGLPIKSDALSVREFVAWRCPDITDAEMVRHLTRNIDRLLGEGKTDIAASLLSSLHILDNPDAEKQLEHYLSAAFSEEVQEKARAVKSRYFNSADASIADFQIRALKNLLVALPFEERMERMEEIMRGNLYTETIRSSGIILPLFSDSTYKDEADPVIRERYLELQRNAMDWEESPLNRTRLDFQLVQLDPSWQLSPRRRQYFERRLVQKDITEGGITYARNKIDEIDRLREEQTSGQPNPVIKEQKGETEKPTTEATPGLVANAIPEECATHEYITATPIPESMKSRTLPKKWMLGVTGLIIIAFIGGMMIRRHRK